jgi:catechol 2,3-dioxygenase-like lactoylglutathione lyase family enzyme
MANQISSGAVHHLTLTVTNLQRSLDFYTEVLGFQVAMELGPTRVFSVMAVPWWPWVQRLTQVVLFQTIGSMKIESG